METGKINRLIISRETDYGYFLEDRHGNEVLLPNAYKNNHMSISDELEVFIYKDSEDRLVATTLIPYVQVGEFAFLKVKQVNKFGAFLDWGLPKDLMAPFALQAEKMKEGNSYLIYLVLDEKSDRLVATSKVNKFIVTSGIELQPGEKVDLILFEKTNLGMNSIVNNCYKGLIFDSDVHREIHPGERTTGYVKEVRKDGKIDLVLDPPGYLNSKNQHENTILSALKENDGFLGLSDSSSPDEIRKWLGMSKKAFKKTVGSLYKQKLVIIEKNGIKIVL